MLLAGGSLADRCAEARQGLYAGLIADRRGSVQNKCKQASWFIGNASGKDAVVGMYVCSYSLDVLDVSFMAFLGQKL